MKEYWCLALTLLGLVFLLQSVDTAAIDEKLRKRSLYNTEGFDEDHSASEMELVENEDVLIHFDRELYSSMSMPTSKSGKSKSGKSKSGKSGAKHRMLHNTDQFVDYSFLELDEVGNEDFFIHFDRELHSSMSMPTSKCGKSKSGKSQSGKSKSGKSKGCTSKSGKSKSGKG